MHTSLPFSPFGVQRYGDQKCPSVFLILMYVKDHVYLYVIINVLKSCHQHSYGFQNLMSSWGSLSKISKLQQVGDSSFFGSKSSLFKPTHEENGILGTTAGAH